MQQKLYGGTESGGTKFICAIGTSPENIIDKVQIPTTSPAETLKSVISFFESHPKTEAIGIASFGPLNLNTSSSTYGYITSTPKAGWKNVDLVGSIKNALGVPVALDTDVNGAALGERLYGAGRGMPVVAYMSVGTGVGIGYSVEGQKPMGLSHTEMGHMIIPRDSTDTAKSSCPFHESCLEGLASGTTLRDHRDQPAQLIRDSKAWDLEARYLAMGIVNMIVALMPSRVVVGGGVMNHSGLIDTIRAQVQVLLNGYLEFPEFTSGIDNYIVTPQLGTLSGVSGALAMASIRSA